MPASPRPSLRIAIIVLSYLGMGIYTVIWTHGAFGLGWDFIIYYLKTQAALSGQSAYFPYEVSGSFLYHPFALSFISPLTWFALLPAWGLWLVASVGAYLASMALLLRRSPAANESRAQRWGTALVILGFGPLWETLHLGQINPFVLLSLVLCLYYTERQRAVHAGIALGIAILLKSSPLIFLAYFVATRRWKLVAAALLTGVFGSLWAYLQFGERVLVEYAQVFGLIAGETLAGNQLNLSAPAITLRLLNSAQMAAAESAVSLVFRGVFGLLTAGFLLYAALKPHSLRWGLGTLTLVMTAASPLVWYHHQLFLLMPLLLLLRKHVVPGALLFLLLQSERLLYNFVGVYFGLPGNFELANALTAGIPTLLTQLALLLALVGMHRRAAETPA